MKSTDQKKVGNKTIRYFSASLTFQVQLDQERTLSDFLNAWKTYSLEEVTNLYYGQVYRVHTYSNKHILLQTRKRPGMAAYLIDCTYKQANSKIVMDIYTSTSVVYPYILWPTVVAIVVFFLRNGSVFSLSPSCLLFVALNALLGALIGAFFLDTSLRTVKSDLQKDMFKITGLKPSL